MNTNLAFIFGFTPFQWDLVCFERFEYGWAFYVGPFGFVYDNGPKE
jgi:hypothetical protein